MSLVKTARMYTALPGASMPDFNYPAGPESGWAQIGTVVGDTPFVLDSEEQYELYRESIELLVKLFDESGRAAIVLGVVNGDSAFFRKGEGELIRKRMNSIYQPRLVESAIHNLNRYIAENLAKEDGVTTPLLDGAL